MPVRDKQRAQVSLQLQLHPQQMLSGAETNWCGRGHCALAIVDQLPMPLRGAGLRTRLVWHGWRGSISRQQLRLCPKVHRGPHCTAYARGYAHLHGWWFSGDAQVCAVLLFCAWVAVSFWLPL